MKEIVQFVNSEFQVLNGVFHKKENFDKNIFINLLNPGIKSRTAPHRLNIKLADELVKSNSSVFRFDPHGIGESDGLFYGDNEDLMYLWSQIQKGAFVNDTVISNKYIYETFKIKKSIMIGQCGAAVTCALTTNYDKNISKCILIDLPTRIINPKMEISDILLENMDRKDILKEIKKDFFRFNWIEKFKNKDNAIKFIKKKIFDIKSILNKPKVDSKIFHERFNIQLAECIINFLKTNKILFIFAENDPAYNDFKGEFLTKILSQVEEKKNFMIEIIPSANHIYYEEESQNKLIDIIVKYTQN